VIEACRRSIGWALPILAIILVAYGFLGRYVPGPLQHAGFSWKRIVAHLTVTTEGIYGQILGVSSTYIYLFILFGATLGATGMSRTFNDIALSVAGSLRGGPAKVSVLASGFMGTISGSTSANIVTTGTFTIPLMKKIGYKNYFAGAVEAAASTGGQIMPPVMGSAAFIIADTLGLPFAKVLRAAIIPAILYFFSIWVMVDLRARKEGIRGLTRDQLPRIKEVLIQRGHLLLPLAGIIYMLVAGYNAITAALVGMALAVVASFLKRDTWIKPGALIKALEAGALGALSVASACAIIGIIIGMVSLTGAILTAGSAILKLSGGILPITLVLTMMTSIVLGMGLPTTACYVLTSTVAAPVLVKLGITPMQAHMFVFYFGILSSITPPVATGAYTAAGLAGSSPSQTGWAAVRLAIAGFIVPFMFIYSPELLLPDRLSLFTMLRVIVSSLIGIMSLGWAVEGYVRRKLKIYERLLCGGAAFLLIDSGLVTDLIGYACIAFVYYNNVAYSKKAKAQLNPTQEATANEKNNPA
jgi:TRAP transporter 4TM/12TM fusion protein